MPKLKIKFTKRALSELPLPAAGGLLVVYDTAVNKLILRVTSRGAKTFAVYKRRGDGKDRQLWAMMAAEKRRR